MESLVQLLKSELFRNSLYVSILIGFACPLVGVFLVLRRLVFMGVALPQISSTGVAFALSIPMWLSTGPVEHTSSKEHLLAFIGSTVFSLVAILVLAFLERRGRGLSEGRLGTGYVVAYALSIIILSKNPHGETGWLDLMKGEVITVSTADFVMTAVALGVVLAVLALFYKELLFVSFDRAMAITLRKNVVYWDAVLYLLIGMTVSMAVLSVGPLISFGFLLIPALAAHLIGRTLRHVLVIAAILGGVSAFLGFWIAYANDLPVGPTDVIVLGLLYAAVWIVQRVVRIFRKPVNVVQTG
jgi:ABC-type Mn2+/Zn2+ transport system permease subunit